MVETKQQVKTALERREAATQKERDRIAGVIEALKESIIINLGYGTPIKQETIVKLMVAIGDLKYECRNLTKEGKAKYIKDERKAVEVGDALNLINVLSTTLYCINNPSTNQIKDEVRVEMEDWLYKEIIDNIEIVFGKFEEINIEDYDHATKRAIIHIKD